MSKPKWATEKPVEKKSFEDVIEIVGQAVPTSEEAPEDPKEVVKPAPEKKDDIPKVEYAKIVNAARVNLRSAPSVGNNIIRTIDEGNEVQIIRRGDEWTEVNGGFIMSQYLSK